MDSIAKLEDGYEFTINGEKETIFGTLAVIVADNLAAHEVGGVYCCIFKGLKTVPFLHGDVGGNAEPFL